MAASGSFIWEAVSPGCLREGKSPGGGSRGEARVVGPEAEAVCRHCLQILNAGTIRKLEKFGSIHSPPDSDKLIVHLPSFLIYLLTLYSIKCL